MANRYIYDNRHIAEGDIFYSSWGYDQTNVDYYMVKPRISIGHRDAWLWDGVPKMQTNSLYWR